MKADLKIKVRGHLDVAWTDWFEGMEISHEGEYTVLSGSQTDDAFVHGILNKIRDLNLKLISVTSSDKE